MNEAKKSIDVIVERLGDARPEEGVDSETYSKSALTSELKAAKRVYRDVFSALNEAKDEVSFLQREKESQMKQLLRGFENWWHP